MVGRHRILCLPFILILPCKQKHAKSKFALETIGNNYVIKMRSLKKGVEGERRESKSKCKHHLWSTEKCFRLLRCSRRDGEREYENGIKMNDEIYSNRLVALLYGIGERRKQGFVLSGATTVGYKSQNPLVRGKKSWRYKT